MILLSKYSDNLWIATSPINGPGAMAEGPWKDWVTLAKNILKSDRKFKELNRNKQEKKA